MLVAKLDRDAFFRPIVIMVCLEKRGRNFSYYLKKELAKSYLPVFIQSAFMPVRDSVPLVRVIQIREESKDELFSRAVNATLEAVPNCPERDAIIALLSKSGRRADIFPISG